MQQASFNVESALKGAPVIQRCGRAARVVDRLTTGEIRVELSVSDDDTQSGESMIVTTVDELGRYNPARGETDCDLFMLSGKLLLENYIAELDRLTGLLDSMRVRANTMLEDSLVSEESHRNLIAALNEAEIRIDDIHARLVKDCLSQQQ